VRHAEASGRVGSGAMRSSQARTDSWPAPAATKAAVTLLSGAHGFMGEGEAPGFEDEAWRSATSLGSKIMIRLRSSASLMRRSVSTLGMCRPLYMRETWLWLVPIFLATSCWESALRVRWCMTCFAIARAAAWASRNARYSRSVFAWFSAASAAVRPIGLIHSLRAFIFISAVEGYSSAIVSLLINTSQDPSVNEQGSLWQ